MKNNSTKLLLIIDIFILNVLAECTLAKSELKAVSPFIGAHFAYLLVDANDVVGLNLTEGSSHDLKLAEKLRIEVELDACLSRQCAS